MIDVKVSVYRYVINTIETTIDKLKDYEVAEISIVAVIIPSILRTEVCAILTIGIMIDLECEIVFIVAVIPELALSNE